MYIALLSSSFFFFNDTATTEIYTLSLHDALPIYGERRHRHRHAEQVPPLVGAPASEQQDRGAQQGQRDEKPGRGLDARSEEHTSELQSQSNLVCRLLLEKKKK